MDQSTIDRARSGDAAARAALVASLSAPFLALAMRMTSSRADAEDATQEALLKVLGSLDGFRGESKFSTWAHAVAARVVLDFRRGAWRKEVLSFDAFSGDLAEGLDLAAPERAEDSVYLGQILVGCARALLLCLDGEHRLAYVVGQVMGLGGPEGAEICGTTEAAFRKRLSRARALIDAALERNCGVVNPSAACRCHRRLARARSLGRTSDTGHAASVDVGKLRAVVQELHSLSARAAAYAAADPGELVPPQLAERLRTLAG